MFHFVKRLILKKLALYTDLTTSDIIEIITVDNK